MKLSSPQFFKAATGNDPYDWQIRLAEDPKGEMEVKLHFESHLNDGTI